MKSILLAALVVAGVSSTLRAASSQPIPAELPDGLELILAAAPPLVTHPIMGAFDDRGRLFVGDAAGVNLNKAELEARLPNRVLMLEDTDGDGGFERVTTFADRMTFPQGACWVDGSLFVASPPGIWKLTDRNGDGVADEREMIVGGFEYDGNAADVHGPFLHPNGRLYWCHGRKGHKVVQKDGTLVHEGRASGIWSCRPDGSDVAWHSLGSMDNPVEVDFTPAGDIVGVVNIHYNQPRADTLVHWIYGGVYQRPDQLAAIAGLPRTIPDMPFVHDFGHVGVSGCTFYRSGALNPAWEGDMLVALFNTQKILRVKLTPQGATFRATEHEFLRIPDPDAHLTDLIEDGDGSLLVLNTGGWFRLGCPSSLAAKPDLRGAIYRVRRKNAVPVADPYGRQIAWSQLSAEDERRLLTDPRWMVRQRAARLSAARSTAATRSAPELAVVQAPADQRDALEQIARSKRLEHGQRDVLLQLLGRPLEPVLEHAAIFAGISTGAFGLEDLRRATAAPLVRRLMLVVEQAGPDSATRDGLLTVARQHIENPDPELARTALAVVVRHPGALEILRPELAAELGRKGIGRGTLALLGDLAATQLAKPAMQDLVTQMLQHPDAEVQQVAWSALARQSGNITNPAWLDPLRASLEAAPNALPVLLEVIARLRTEHFDGALQELLRRERLPAAIQAKALAALSRGGQVLTSATFDILREMAANDASPAARTDATRLLARSRLTQEQMRALVPLLKTAGPVELRILLPLARRNAEEATGRQWAQALAQSPFLGSLEESIFRTNFSSLPPDVYEKLLAPAVRKFADAAQARKHRFESLTAHAAQGRRHAGREVFASSSCVACHRAGELGRALGPDLSRIGGIRQPRDLFESILFPHATIAREFDTQVIETTDGQSVTGLVRQDAADSLTLLDVGGQERVIPRAQVVARSSLPTSLMPEGLDQALTEQQLLDLVAWLSSLQ